MTGAFYGGGHRTKSALDVAYWCQYNVSTFYEEGDVFIPPKAPIDNLYMNYQSLAYAIEQAGVTIPVDYNDLKDVLRINDLYIPPAQAVKTRGALLLNNGTVSLSLGDSRRIIVEENYRLAQKYMDPDQNYLATFEHGALIPGVDYL